MIFSRGSDPGPRFSPEDPYHPLFSLEGWSDQYQGFFFLEGLIWIRVFSNESNSDPGFSSEVRILAKYISRKSDPGHIFL